MRHWLQDGGLQQEILDVRRLLLQNFFEQIVEDIPVAAGEGGDERARVGLPLQSLHDGSDWVHQPLRLSAFVEAPRQALEGVLARHPEVRRLADNGWLHLFRIDPETGSAWQYCHGGWQQAPGRATTAGAPPAGA